ncbi:MAG: ROK family protein, partial [Anaerolineae bacterium]
MDRSACALLRQIYCGGRLTRRDLAARTGLSVPRVSAHVAQMVQLGLVTEEPCQSGLGRPACLLSPASHLARAVGLDLGNGQCQAVLLDAAGQVLASKTRLAPGAPASCRTMIDDVPDLVRSVCSQVGQDPAGLAAVGIGLPGIVDAQSGMVLAWPNTPDQGAWLGTNVRAALADRLHPALVVLEDFVRA